MRPSIAIPQNQVVDLDGFFGLHPSLAAFKPLYDQGHLAIVHACGSPDMSRSHFDAQDYMESGTPGVKATEDGWLNRALQAEDYVQLRARHREEHTAFRALALGADVPLTLAGKIPAIAISNVNNFTVAGRGPAPSPAASAFEAMYADSGDRIFHAAGDETFEAVKMLRAANPAQYVPAAGVNYPSYGVRQQHAADCATAEGEPRRGSRVYRCDRLGHASEPGRRERPACQPVERFLCEHCGLLARHGRRGRERDAGDDVGVRAHGARKRHGGTDHGHANAMFVLGGQVKGGKVYGKWPGLENEQLNEGRDLALTTDYRQVLGEVVTHTLGAENLELVFPGARLSRAGFLKLV